MAIPRVYSAPHLSIVIPCPGGGDLFEETLVSVLQNRPEDCEILVVYPGTYADPYNLRGEVDFVEAPVGATLLELVNLGFDCAQGDVVHLLQCGVEVDEGWTAAVRACFDDPRVGAAAPVLFDKLSDAPPTIGVRYGLGGRRVCVVAGGRDPEGQSLVLGPTLRAAFYRREAVRSVGGVDPAVGEELADVDLALSLQEAGYRAVVVLASGTRYRPGASLPGRDEFREALREERLFRKHAAAKGWRRSLLGHAWHIACETIVSFPRPRTFTRLLGRACAWLEKAPACPPASPPEAVPASARYRAGPGRRSKPELGVPSRPAQAAAGAKRHVA